RRSVEAFVLDHHADLYGRRVRVRFTGRVRGMVAVGTMPVDVDLPAAVSVGSNPTFGDARRSVEAFVLDHHADLYGRRVRVRFTGRVRGMVAFSGVDELMDAIARDVAQVRGMTVAPTSA
ncbi:hypothetical protein MTQ22_06085, partial [Corynebacterium bovis]|uniref:riboflavin kinase n=1 Tax=Corynebacterium bovis TaxID=36808 RepID=UPI00313A47EB